jgi:hypothetical protein
MFIGRAFIFRYEHVDRGIHIHVGKEARWIWLVLKTWWGMGMSCLRHFLASFFSSVRGLHHCGRV